VPNSSVIPLSEENNIENQPPSNKQEISRNLRRSTGRVNHCECDLATAHLIEEVDARVKFLHKCATDIKDKSKGLWTDGNMQAALINAVVKQRNVLLLKNTTVSWSPVMILMQDNGYKHFDEEGHDNLMSVLQNRWVSIKVGDECNNTTAYS
jgi:hypothetical protein